MDANPNRNMTTPTHTMPLRLASFALNSRAVSFCAAPSSVLARVSSCSTTGIQSRIHEVWAYAQGTQVRERESGFRYRPTVCFETFPFPFADDLSEQPDNTEATLNAAKHYAHITLHEDPVPYRAGKPLKKSATEIRAAIAAAAKELNALRERWLNPPEWTVEKILEFPGSVAGPWSRYIDPSSCSGGP